MSSLEKKENITTFELDKFKLLVNESDVINNLLIKLENKLALTQNSIQVLLIKQLQLATGNDGASSINEEIEMMRQEVMQIRRKREEALFLKNGIDKRATTVADFLKNYFDRDQLNEFELFITLKSVNAYQLRHIRDHIELAQLQLKLLDELNFKQQQQHQQLIRNESSTDDDLDCI